MANNKNGHFNATPHGQFIRDFIKDNEDLRGKITRDEIAERFANTKDGYKISTEQVRTVLRGMGEIGYTLNGMVAKFQGNRLQYEAERLGADPQDVPFGWVKEEGVSLFVRNNMPKETLNTVVEESLAKMKKHSPKYRAIKRKKITEPHLFVIDPADVHLGKLALAVETGEDYNTEIAKQRCIEGVEGLLQKAQGFPIEKFMLVIGNDILHIDVPSRKTTSGTPQDTDGQLHQIYLEGLDLYVQIIERLMGIADVEVVYNPSNHDYMSGYMLAQTLAAWFRLSKNVSFDVSIRHRKYTRYGENLIATSHGDGARHQDMPLLMAAEAKDWSDTKFRYIYLHHLHHKKKVKWQDAGDMPGVSYQILRSPSAPDGWHDRNGYTCQPRAIEGFIHHKEQGQIATLTHYFN